MSEYPEGTLIEVTMTIRLPKAATEDEVDAALKFHFGANGSCSNKNPLINELLEPWGFSFDWQDTGRTGRIEKFDIKMNDDGSGSWKQRYITEQRK